LEADGKTSTANPILFDRLLVMANDIVNQYSA